MPNEFIISQIKAQQRFNKVRPGVKKRPTPEWLYPIHSQRVYTKRLLDYIKEIERFYNENVLSQTERLFNNRDLVIQRSDDDIDDLESLTNTVGFILDEDEDGKITEILQGIPESIEQFNQLQWQKIVRAKLGIQLFTHEPWLEPMIKAWNVTNSALIKRFPVQVNSSIQEIVLRNYMNGGRHETMIEEIQKLYNTTENNARRIARDQTNKLNGDMMKQRQQDIGVTHYFWRDSDDTRVRPTHRKFDGQRYSWDVFGDRPAPEGNPGQPIQCLPGDTRINYTFGVKKIYRRRYEGKLVKLVTSGDNTLTITPNHPILTKRGWVVPNDINIGDDIIDIVFNKTFPMLHDIDDQNISIKQMFDFLSIIFPISGFTGSGLQFHGDGGPPEHKVNIIDIESFLPKEGDIHIYQQLFEEFLTISNTALSEFSVFSKTEQMFNTLFPTPSAIIGGFCKLFAFISAASLKSNDISLTSISERYVIFFQSLSNYAPAYIEFFRNFFNAQFLETVEGYNIINRHIFSIMGMLSNSHIMNINIPVFEDFDNILSSMSSTTKGNCSISEGVPLFNKSNKVIKKSIIDFNSHVYNLETNTNYYSLSEKYIVSNCRCWGDPDFSDIDELLK